MAPSKILFLTNSDYGQANVVLATLHSLIHTATPDTELHVASFAELSGAVDHATTYAATVAPPNRPLAPVHFHILEGTTNRKAAERPEVGMVEAYDLTPGLVNSAKNILIIPGIMQPWRPDEFAQIYREAERVLDEVRPDLTIVEPLFTPGLTLCGHRGETKGLNWLVLAPNTIKDFAVPVQPALAALWKYPLVCSALPFPLPWYYVPQNIALNLVAGYMLVTDTRLKDTAAYLRQHVDPAVSLMTANELGVLKAPPPGLRILVANSPEIDYPFAVLPSYVVPCGPIVRAAPSVQEVDPLLAAWLGRNPTVYVSLGTHLAATASEAAEMARAVRQLLDRAAASGRRLQVLWKLRRKTAPEETKMAADDFSDEWMEMRDILGPRIDADDVRITDWVTAEPKSILESGHVICSVNHGGASSFNESLCAGVPQVLLPPWSDCYDFANRVELLGIGRWANKIAKPRWGTDELAVALEEVVLGPQATAIKQRAVSLAARFSEATGRDTAAREILSALRK